MRIEAIPEPLENNVELHRDFSEGNTPVRIKFTGMRHREYGRRNSSKNQTTQIEGNSLMKSGIPGI
jgi:hypothetical protein